jgi:hypothetical protein
MVRQTHYHYDNLVTLGGSNYHVASEAEGIAANKEPARPSRSVFALLEKSGGSESAAEVGNVPDHEAYGDGERLGWHEPDSLCRIAESCGNMGPNGGHDGDGPQ